MRNAFSCFNIQNKIFFNKNIHKKIRIIINIKILSSVKESFYFFGYKGQLLVFNNLKLSVPIPSLFESRERQKSSTFL